MGERSNELYEEILGLRYVIANCHQALDKSQQALEEALELLRLTERLHGPRHPDTYGGRNLIGTAPRDLGREDEALELPLDQADIDTDFLIGIAKTDHKALDIWFGSAQIMMHSLTAHMIAAYPPDIYFRPHVAAFGALEFWRVREIVAHAEAEKERFKRILADKVEAWTTGRVPVIDSNPDPL